MIVAALGRQSDSMPVNRWDYNEDLRRCCGPDVPPPPAWLRPLANADAGSLDSSGLKNTFPP